MDFETGRVFDGNLISRVTDFIVTMADSGHCVGQNQRMSHFYLRVWTICLEQSLMDRVLILAANNIDFVCHWWYFLSKCFYLIFILEFLHNFVDHCGDKSVRGLFHKSIYAILYLLQPTPLDVRHSLCGPHKLIEILSNLICWILILLLVNS